METDYKVSEGIEKRVPSLSFQEEKYCLNMAVSPPSTTRSTRVHLGSEFFSRKASADFMALMRSSLEDSLPIQAKIPLVEPVSRMKQSCNDF